MPTHNRPVHNIFAARGMVRGLLLAGLLAATSLRLAASDPVPADYVSTGNTAIDFPRQPAPQYAVVDMVDSEIVDLNDNGQLLLAFWSDDTYSYTYKLWTAGAAVNITAADGNYSYNWLGLADNGTVLGTYYDDTDGDYGFVSWTIGGGASRVSYATAAAPYVSGTIVYLDWSGVPLVTRNALYFPVVATTQTTLGTDADSNPYGYNNDYRMMLCLNANGTVTKVGDVIFDGGELSPTGSFSMPYDLARDAATDTLTMTFTGSYANETDGGSYVSSYAYDEDDDEYDLPVYSNFTYNHTYSDWDTFAGTLTLNSHSITNPESYDGQWIWPPYNAYPSFGFFYPWAPVVADIGGNSVLLNPYYGDEGTTVDTISGGSVASANLTAGSNTTLEFAGLNSNGLGLTDSSLWLNGNILTLADSFPEWAITNGTLNANALLPAVSWGVNATLSVSSISSTSNLAVGWVEDEDSNYRQVLLIPAALAVDNNRDGNISFDIDDKTTEANPFAFWLNDDIDVAGDEESYPTVQDDLDPTSGNVDWTKDTITCTRDLEDFARLSLNIGALQSDVSGGNIYIGLKWVPFANVTFNGTNDPAIKLFVAYGSGNGAYLTNSTIASDQITGNYANAIQDVSGVTGGANHTIVQPSDNDWDFVFPQSVFANLTSANSTIHLLFDGCQRSQGTLSLVLLSYNGTGYTKMGGGPGVCLDLKDVKEMYERWTVGDGSEPFLSFTSSGGGGAPAANATISTDRLPGNVTGLTYGNLTEDEAGTPYILFVHGWNMHPWEKDAFAETAFKRLYWQGYQGRFGTFEWPCTYHTESIAAVTDYDEGEYTAWLSAVPLEGLLAHLASMDGSGNLSVMAHSMGNVVTGEALRLAATTGAGELVHVYVASQAAVPAQVYDGNITTGYPLSFDSLLGGAGFYGPTTPNIYDNWMSSNGNSTGTRINYYNVNDFALSSLSWQYDQVLKPDSLAGIYTNLTGGNYSGRPYGYNGTTSNFYKTEFNSGGSTIGNYTLNLGDAGNVTNGSIDDRYEIMAFDSEPRSLPLGIVSGNISGLSKQSLPDIWPADPLDGNDYHTHPWHSAEFRFDNMNQSIYWRKLLQAFGLIPPD